MANLNHKRLVYKYRENLDKEPSYVPMPRTSRGPVNSMHLLLLHPHTLIRQNRTTYKSMNEVLNTGEISAKKLSFSDPESLVNEDDQFVLFVLFKLMRAGCKFFVKNMALRLPAGKKEAIHCDLVGYHPNKEIIYVISYVRKKSRTKKTWLHSRIFSRAISKMVSSATAVKQIVVPFHVYETSKRIYFRSRDPFLSK